MLVEVHVSLIETHKVMLLGVGAGLSLGATLVTWNAFLPYWKKNNLGNEGGGLGVVVTLHQWFIMLSVLPAALYAGSYLGGDDGMLGVLVMIVSIVLVVVATKLSNISYVNK